MESIVFLVVAVLVVAVVVGFLRLNAFYRSTNTYLNRYAYARNYIKKPKNDLELVNLGSTYSQFACQSYGDFTVKAYNLALYSRPVVYDYYILRKYAKYIDKNGVVLQFLSPGLFLLDERYEDNSGNHCFVLSPFEMNKQNIIQWLKVRVPILRKPHIGACFYDVAGIDINEKYLKEIDYHTVEFNMEQRVSAWKMQFNLENLMDENLTEVHKKSIRVNLKVLSRIEAFCASEKYKLIFVVPPFSDTLNQMLGAEFCKKVLYEPLKQKFPKIPLLDYRESELFAEEHHLFVDGGFLLNKAGSRKFLGVLIKQLYEEHSLDLEKRDWCV